MSYNITITDLFFFLLEIQKRFSIIYFKTMQHDYYYSNIIIKKVLIITWHLRPFVPYRVYKPWEYYLRYATYIISDYNWFFCFSSIY